MNNNALHLTNIIVNGIVRILLIVFITKAAFYFDNVWLLALYLIPGCMMASVISTKPKKGEKSDESENDEQTC